MTNRCGFPLERQAFCCGRLSLLFENVMGDGKSSDKLSDNIVYSFHEADDENLWVGTNNGLNLYHSDTGKVEQFLVTDDDKAVISSGSIFTIRPKRSNLATYVRWYRKI